MNQATSPAAQTDQTSPAKQDASVRWRKLLDDHRASGLPVSVFCRERGIPESSLFAWRRRLAGGDEPAFKPVKIVATVPTRARHDDRGSGSGSGDQGSERTVELHLPRGRRVVVRRGFDRQLLLDVIAALESRP